MHSLVHPIYPPQSWCQRSLKETWWLCNNWLQILQRKSKDERANRLCAINLYNPKSEICHCTSTTNLKLQVFLEMSVLVHQVLVRKKVQLTRGSMGWKWVAMSRMKCTNRSFLWMAVARRLPHWFCGWWEEKCAVFLANIRAEQVFVLPWVPTRPQGLSEGLQEQPGDPLAIPPRTLGRWSDVHPP